MFESVVVKVFPDGSRDEVELLVMLKQGYTYAFHLGPTTKATVPGENYPSDPSIYVVYLRAPHSN